VCALGSSGDAAWVGYLQERSRISAIVGSSVAQLKHPQAQQPSAYAKVDSQNDALRDRLREATLG